MSGIKGAVRAVLVVYVALCALSAASAAAEAAAGQGTAAVVGRRKMLAVRDLLQTKPAVSGPCAQHTQATKQQITTGSSNQTKQPQNKLATKGAAAVTAPNNRQLLQAPTPKPTGPLTPAQRRGFATGRSGAPNPKQQRRPPTASG